MKKLQIEADKLLEYPAGDRDTLILKGLIEFGTVNSLVRNTDFKKRTVHRRLAFLRKAAIRLGYNPKEPVRSPVLTHPLGARSDFVKHDPPLADGTTHTWYKQKAEDVVLVDAIKSAVEGIAVPKVKTTDFKYKRSEIQDILSMLVLADTHLGILARDGWGLEENLELVKNLVRRQIDQMQPVKQGLLMNVGDLTHTDGLVAQTSKSKNPLDVNALYFDICKAATELLVFTIEGMRTKCEKLTVINVPGNHDFETSFHTNQKLQERYSKDKHIKILDNDQSHIPFVWKKNFIVGWHGDTAPNARAYEFITSEWPKECGNAEHIHVAKGHFHRAQEEYVGRACFQTFVSSTKADAYHDFKMFKARRGLTRLDFDPEGGAIGGLTVRPRKGE